MTHPRFKYKDLVELHKELWIWQADNPNIERKYWPGLKDLHPEMLKQFKLDKCFACMFEVQRVRDEKRGDAKVCQLCPFLFTHRMGFSCLNGLYQEWKHAPTYEIKRQIALQIANLPLTTEAKKIILQEELSNG